MANNYSPNGREYTMLEELARQQQRQRQRQHLHQRQFFQSSAVAQPPPNDVVTANELASAAASLHFSQTPAAIQRLYDPSNNMVTIPTKLHAIRQNPLLQQRKTSGGRVPIQAELSRAHSISTHSISSSFWRVLFFILNRAECPGAMRWSADGTGFHVNQEHPNFLSMIYPYFNSKTFSDWYRQLKNFGWTEITSGNNKGMMFNECFHRDMNEYDFLALSRAVEANRKSPAKRKELQQAKRNENEARKVAETKKASTTISKKNKEKAIQRKVAETRKASNNISKKNKEKAIYNKVTKTKKASTTISKKKKEESIYTESSMKSKGTRITKVAGRSKTALGVVSSALNKKKRKNPPNSPDEVVKNQSEDCKNATKRLREHKKLHDLFWKWNMWSFPEGLDVFLKVQSFENKNGKKADVADDELEILYDNKEEMIADLLCDEEMPESIFGKQDEKQAIADFVERIRTDKLQQDKLKDRWSNSVAPIVKGKTLAASKFSKPTDKWRNAKAGDRIGVYWRDDAIFYTAMIQKQQENTSYFHLIYDDDGAQEWLDLSRENFKILEDTKKSITAVEPTRRAQRHSLKRVTNETPRKDNRVQSLEENRDKSKSITLPDSHSHLAPFVRYSWNGLGLGNHAGTSCYNEFVREKDALAPRVTALEILNDVRALRSRGFSGISLQIDSENSSNEISNEMNNGNNHNDDKGILSFVSNPIVANELRHLQDKISKDDDAPSSIKHFNHTLNAVRKLTDEWSIPMVRENLRTIETQVLKLNEEEARILEKCRKKGLC